MHKRLFPKENQFTYGVYYVVLPLESLDHLKLSGITSFHTRDHGARDGGDLKNWAMTILADYGLNEKVKNIVLIAMPRLFGYVFNPVSFWLCMDENAQVRAVLYEVNNTFGESHTYVCAHENHRIIEEDDWLMADKVFHVSPFLPREGQYKFRVAMKDNKLGIWIDYYDKQSGKQLITALSGVLSPLTPKGLRIAFWKHPLVTVKVITLIHFQAIKLMRKGIQYICKPKQLELKQTGARNLTKLS